MEKFQLSEGITLRCFRDDRFKQGCLSVQLVRLMCREEAAENALLPAVLLRGTEKTPDLRAITLRLDDLYGASVSARVRRIGDYQTTGLQLGFIDDQYAIAGDEIFCPMVDFLEELLFAPLLEEGAFCRSFVESEKKNLIATIEAEKNDKRDYAAAQLFAHMCKTDSFGIPRLGEKEKVAAITPEGLYGHYQKILKDSRIDLFYVGSNDPKKVADRLKEMFAGKARDYKPLPAQTAFCNDGGGRVEETMEVVQGKLCVGYVTPITMRTESYAAMQLCSSILGGGMTSKLFTEVREKLSLCYDIGAGYYGSKGILTVSAGIDCNMRDTVENEIEKQIAAICNGDISEEELQNAKMALCSALRGTHDTPGAIEGYYATGALSGMQMTPEGFIENIGLVTKAQVAQAAQTLEKHTVFFLKGVQ